MDTCFHPDPHSAYKVDDGGSDIPVGRHMEMVGSVRKKADELAILEVVQWVQPADYERYEQLGKRSPEYKICTDL